MKTVKKVLSSLLLIISLTGIIWGTIYILNNNGLSKNITKKSTATIEKATTNESKNSLSEIYNINLNNTKHKVKLEYQLINKSDGSLNIMLYVYFDGKNVLEKTAKELNLTVADIDDSLTVKDNITNIRINENSFKIIKMSNNDYLLMEIGIEDNSLKRYYYLVDNMGNIKNDFEILVYDSNKNYIDTNNKPFLNYYDNEKKTLAKIDNDNIYVLESKESKDKITLIEYKYYFVDNELKKEKIQVFENLRLESNKTEE